MNEILKVERVSEKYQAENGEVAALEDISFSVGCGEFVSIVGPSGCGKSTLLSIIAGIIKPTYGTVFIDGIPVNGISPRVGYMLQRDNLLEWRSIFKNVMLGLEIQKRATAESEEYVKELLNTYGLYEFRDKYPSQLSGGMRQRAALIRTLAVKPQIFLLDEAFSALDYQTRLAVTDDVYGILKRENKTTLMVTHDISESISMSDRVIVLTRRPGRISKIHDIAFSMEDRMPVRCREQPEFQGYFNAIWKELDIHV
ncbi:MAG: ABC transporter ATP-binding protein [Oscillospiraceae bacterium]|nr:ABC transporter ATP-binding protein [Oscillospiraceae bacterium]